MESLRVKILYISKTTKLNLTDWISDFEIQSVIFFDL